MTEMVTTAKPARSEFITPGYLGATVLVIFILYMGLWPASFVDKISPTVTDFLLRVGG